jgi:hypothetical protein
MTISIIARLRTIPNTRDKESILNNLDDNISADRSGHNGTKQWEAILRDVKWRRPRDGGKL